MPISIGRGERDPGPKNGIERSRQAMNERSRYSFRFDLQEETKTN